MLLKKNPMGQQWNQRGNLKIPWDKWQWKHNHTKSMGWSKSSPKREVHSYTGLPQKTRKVSNKQPNLPPKKSEREETTKLKGSRRKEIMKIREEINKIEIKK